MAKKFGSIKPIRVEMPTEDKGGVMGWLVTQLNRVLEGLVTQINDVLQRSTARMTDLPIWCRGQIITVRGEDAGGENTKDIAVRHGLGVAPRYWIILNHKWAWPETASTAEALSIIRSETTWTDTHVFFKLGGSTAIAFDILLIP